MSYKLALIGSSISHSKSKEIYLELLGKGNYHLFDFRYFPSKEIFFSLCQKLNGLSITSPYKEEVFKLALVDDELKDLKAINCIKLVDGNILGTNTDYYACKKILKAYQSKGVRSVLLLGSGAMSRVLISLFCKLGIRFTQLKRSDGSLLNYSSHSLNHDLLINACAREFDLSALRDFGKMKIWDLNYEQKYENFFLSNYPEDYSSGMELLIEQAKLSLLFWQLK